MAVERDFKIVRTVERLNRIIHESRLTTRFVSLFYGEIEDDGNLMYVNAGHPHPLHFHGPSVTPLVQTGVVLGPTANATYSRGYRRLEPGDSLLLYTDGMPTPAQTAICRARKAVARRSFISIGSPRPGRASGRSSGRRAPSSARSS